MDRERNQVVVVGGGAAGMIAAAAAADSGRRVIILEKNEKLGKKLVSNPKFLYSAFHELDNFGVMALLENNGCNLKTERGERVFPVSDHASDVTAAFQRLLRKKGVEVRLHCAVRGIES